MKLTDTKVKNAKITMKTIVSEDGETKTIVTRKLADGKGLHLYIRDNGTKCWRYAYRLHGKAQLYTIGDYPEFSLKDAREKHVEARRLVQEGQHPTRRRKLEFARQEAAESATFESVADKWFNYRLKFKSVKKGTSKPLKGANILYATNAIKDLNDRIGKQPISAVTRNVANEVIEEIRDEKSPSRAKRARDFADDIYEWAISKAIVEENPFSRVEAPMPETVNHRHFETKAELGEALRKVGTLGDEKLRILLLLTAHLFPRKSELIEATWTEFDFQECEWTIPAARMKMGRLHIVPLSRQVMALLNRLKELTGDSQYLFPSSRKPSRPVSKPTPNRVLEQLGINVPPHGFRGTASTMLHGARKDKRQIFEPHVIEAQLSHMPNDKVAASYNHSKYLPARHDLMQWWSDELERISDKETHDAASNIVPMHREARA